jgi:hypothetical protein
LKNNLSLLIFLLLISPNLFAQSGFITEETTKASFKMGSMESSVYKHFSENTYYSKMDFSFKGKGLARLMSRDLENGTIISFQDSTIININHKKNRFTKKLLSQILEEKESESENESENESKNENQEDGNPEEESFIPIISDKLELVNGFESYKVTLSEDDNSNQNVWVTSTARKSIIVKSMQSRIDEFERNWINFDGNFTEIGIDRDVIIVKAVFSDEEGSFEYNLNVYAPTDSLPTMFDVPEDYKKVKKLKMF